jgi:lia operon protein LiaH
MANLFSRIKDTIAADLNETLNQKENQHPIALLNQYLRECEQETEKVHKLVERQYQLKDEFTNEYNHALDLTEKRQQDD